MTLALGGLVRLWVGTILLEVSRNFGDSVVDFCTGVKEFS